MNTPVRVNTEACDSVVALLRGHHIPEDREDSSLPNIPRELVPNFYFYLVGICHQTSPLNLPPVEGVVSGKHRRGWDYLFARLEQASAKDPRILSVERWTQESVDSLSKLFTDTEYGLRLTGIPSRVELICNMGVTLTEQGLDSITGIYERCQGHILAHEPNLLDELAYFKAYADPVQKKSIFFLSIMRNSGLWVFPDDEQLEAPVDYHEVRGHLRLGTVRINDQDLEFRIRHRANVTEQEDLAIRMATRTAIRYIADGLFLTPSRVHYLFWNIFRSICTRFAPECLKLRPDNPLPMRYRHLTALSGPPPKCPFATVCPSAHLESRLIEHVIETDYY